MFSLTSFKLIGLAISLAVFSVTAPAKDTQMVQVEDGISLHVMSGGKSDANLTLVFVPGWSTGGYVWQIQFDHFAPKYRVLTFDPRSQGESTKTMNGNTPEMRAQDLHALMQRLNAKHPVLIGWSQGVQDVAAYVERYGAAEIAGIVLVDAAVSDGADGIVRRPAETTQQFKMFAVYQAHQPEYLRGMWQAISSQPRSPALIQRLVATGMKTSSSIGIAMLVADMFGVDRTPALEKMKCPTLVIASSKSEELERQQSLTKQVLTAHFDTIEDAAHAVFLDQPDRFNEILSRFLDGLPAKP